MMPDLVAPGVPFWKDGDLWMSMSGSMEDAAPGLEVEAFQMSHGGPYLGGPHLSALAFFNFSKYLRDEISKVDK